MHIQGKGYVDITIGEFSDFLGLENELEQFRVTHHCGVAGTLFEVSFKTRNEKLASMFVQNNPVHFSYGVSPDKAHEMDAWITEVSQNTDKQGLIKIGFGAVPTVDLFTDRTSYSLYGGSFYVMQEYLKGKFGEGSMWFQGADSEEIYSMWEKVVQIEEPQTWTKNQSTMAQFILELWLHANFGEDVPLVAFSRNFPNTLIVTTTEILKKFNVNDIVHFNPEPRDKNETTNVIYVGNFNNKSYKFTTGYATGYDTAIYINNLEGGKDSVFVPGKSVTLATGKKAERKFSGYRAMDNKYQNENTHGKYQTCYYQNYYRLVDLSSLVGTLVVKGDIPEEIDLLSPVYVDSGDSKTEGRWIVNTLQSTMSMTSAYTTTVYVCRDNYNRIEDILVDAEKNDDHEIINIENQQVADALQSVRNLNLAVARAQKLIDGTTKADLKAFCSKTKYGFLTMFRVNGRMVDLTSRLGMMHTLITLGNDIMNSLVDKLFKFPYNMLLHDFLINKPSLLSLLKQLIYTSSLGPYASLWGEILKLLSEIVILMGTIRNTNLKRVQTSVNGTLVDFKEDANGDYTFGGSSTINPEDEDMPVDRTEENTENIKNITDEILDNTEGLDIPIPDITLDNSESLMPIEDLKEVIAEKVENYLRGQGYLEGVDKEDFISILRGKKVLDFNTIKLINGNKGNMLYARYWGTYNGTLEKMGRVIDISDKVVTVSHVDLLDEVFEGDTVVINGIPSSSGSYTVDEVHLQRVVEDEAVYFNTLIKVKEEIKSYTYAPMLHYNNLCSVTKITAGHTVDDKTDLSAIHIAGKVTKGQVDKFLANGLFVNITNADQNAYFAIYKTEYKKDTKETIVYTETVLKPVANKNMMLQIVISVDSEASLSKLSNFDFTEFYIKNSFKDIYTTIPCTKIVSALRDSKVWVALPNTEENLLFFLNNKKADMDVINSIDLGLYNAAGLPLPYNIYMSKETFNSNNVILEIRKDL